MWPGLHPSSPRREYLVLLFPRHNGFQFSFTTPGARRGPSPLKGNEKAALICPLPSTSPPPGPCHPEIWRHFGGTALNPIVTPTDSLPLDRPPPKVLQVGCGNNPGVQRSLALTTLAPEGGRSLYVPSSPGPQSRDCPLRRRGGLGFPSLHFIQRAGQSRCRSACWKDGAPREDFLWWEGFRAPPHPPPSTTP